MTKKIVHESWRGIEQTDTSKRLERILVLPDVHAPYHCVKSWQLMLRAAYGFKPDRVIQMGDMCDFYAISSFDKSPERLQQHNLIDEVRITNELLDDLDGLGAKNYHYITGNHSDRWIRFLNKQAPQLVGFKGMSIPEMFKFKERGWTVTPYRQHLKLGRCFFTHDIGQSGAGAHISARNEYQSNAVIAHTHNCGISYKGNAQGKVHIGAVFGHLADEKYLDYTHQLKARQWVKGFGTGMMESNGNIHFQAHPIFDGRVVVNGVLYK